MEKINWRNPKKELPSEGELVWVMLEPHKNRGSLLASTMSIEIVCGEVSYGRDGSCVVFNHDELGQGNIGWLLNESKYHWETKAIAWIPINEMTLPNFYKC